MHWIFDHLLVLVLVVLFPLWSWYETRKKKRALAESGETDHNAVSEYKQTMLALWGLCATCLVVWFLHSRPSEILGLGVGTESLLRWGGGLAIAAAGLVFTFWQAEQVKKDEKARDEIQKQVGEFSFYLPKTRVQLRWFNWVALSAGICEEILYRGYLIWYIALLTGSIPALFLSSIGFGIAHSYQGPGNAVRCGVVGLWMGTIYLVTGSLWIPMVTHFLVDVIGGRMIYHTFSEATPPAEGRERTQSVHFSRTGGILNDS